MQAEPANVRRLSYSIRLEIQYIYIYIYTYYRQDGAFNHLLFGASQDLSQDQAIMVLFCGLSEK